MDKIKFQCSNKSISAILKKSRVSYFLEFPNDNLSWRASDTTVIADSSYKKIGFYKQHKLVIYDNGRLSESVSDELESWQKVHQIYLTLYSQAECVLAVDEYDFINHYRVIRYYAIYNFKFLNPKKTFNQELSELIWLFADYVNAVTKEKSTHRILNKLLPKYKNFLEKYKEQNWQKMIDYLSKSLISPDIAEQAILRGNVK